MAIDTFDPAAEADAIRRAPPPRTDPTVLVASYFLAQLQWLHLVAVLDALSSPQFITHFHLRRQHFLPSPFASSSPSHDQSVLPLSLQTTSSSLPLTTQATTRSAQSASPHPPPTTSLTRTTPTTHTPWTSTCTMWAQIPLRTMSRFRQTTTATISTAYYTSLLRVVLITRSVPTLYRRYIRRPLRRTTALRTMAHPLMNWNSKPRRPCPQALVARRRSADSLTGSAIRAPPGPGNLSLFLRLPLTFLRTPTALLRRLRRLSPSRRSSRRDWSRSCPRGSTSTTPPSGGSRTGRTCRAITSYTPETETQPAYPSLMGQSHPHLGRRSWCSSARRLKRRAAGRTARLLRRRLIYACLLSQVAMTPTWAAPGSPSPPPSSLTSPTDQTATASAPFPPLMPPAPGSPPRGPALTHLTYGHGTHPSGRFLLLDVKLVHLRTLLRLLHSPCSRQTASRRLDSEAANALNLTLAPAEDRMLFDSIHDLNLSSAFNTSDIRLNALHALTHMSDLLFDNGRFRTIHSLSRRQCVLLSTHLFDFMLNSVPFTEQQLGTAVQALASFTATALDDPSSHVGCEPFLFVADIMFPNLLGPPPHPQSPGSRHLLSIATHLRRVMTVLTGNIRTRLPHLASTFLGSTLLRSRAVFGSVRGAGRRVRAWFSNLPYPARTVAKFATTGGVAALGATLATQPTAPPCADPPCCTGSDCPIPPPSPDCSNVDCSENPFFLCCPQSDGTNHALATALRNIASMQQQRRIRGFPRSYAMFDANGQFINRLPPYASEPHLATDSTTLLSHSAPAGGSLPARDKREAFVDPWPHFLIEGIPTLYHVVEHTIHPPRPRCRRSPISICHQPSHVHKRSTTSNDLACSANIACLVVREIKRSQVPLRHQEPHLHQPANRFAAFFSALFSPLSWLAARFGLTGVDASIPSGNPPTIPWSRLFSSLHLTNCSVPRVARAAAAPPPDHPEGTFHRPVQSDQSDLLPTIEQEQDFVLRTTSGTSSYSSANTTVERRRQIRFVHRLLLIALSWQPPENAAIDRRRVEALKSIWLTEAERRGFSLDDALREGDAFEALIRVASNSSARPSRRARRAAALPASALLTLTLSSSSTGGAKADSARPAGLPSTYYSTPHSALTGSRAVSLPAQSATATAQAWWNRYFHLLSHLLQPSRPHPFSQPALSRPRRSTLLSSLSASLPYDALFAHYAYLVEFANHTSDLVWHAGSPCMAQCNTTGFCDFCGPLGVCCAWGLSGQGCDGSMGLQHVAVCVNVAPQPPPQQVDSSARHPRAFWAFLTPLITSIITALTKLGAVAGTRAAMAGAAVASKAAAASSAAIAAAPGAVLTAGTFVAKTTVGSALIIGGAYAVQNALESGTVPHNDSIVGRNLGKDCMAECGWTGGFCQYCGAEGLCCQRGYARRGCDGSMGEPGRSICVMPTFSLLADSRAYILDNALFETANSPENREQQLSFLYKLILNEIDRADLSTNTSSADHVNVVYHNDRRRRSTAPQLYISDFVGTTPVISTEPPTHPIPPARLAPFNISSPALHFPGQTAVAARFTALQAPSSAASLTDLGDAISVLGRHLAQHQRRLGRPAQPPRRRRAASYPPARPLSRHQKIAFRLDALERTCKPGYPRLYRNHLPMLLYMCEVPNLDVRPDALPLLGKLEMPRQQQKPRSKRQAPSPPAMHILSDPHRLSALLRHLHVSDLPEVFYILLENILINGTVDQAEFYVLDTHYRLTTLLSVLEAAPVTSRPPYLGTARELVRTLRSRRLLLLPCGAQPPPTPGTVTSCELKHAYIADYLAAHLMRHVLPPRPSPSGPPRSRFRRQVSPPPRRHQSHREDHAHNGVRHPIGRDGNGNVVYGPNGAPNVMPQCETVARAPRYDGQLLTLAILRCLTPANEVTSMLYYLALQANLLEMYDRNRLQWLPRPPASRNKRQASHQAPATSGLTTSSPIRLLPKQRNFDLRDILIRIREESAPVGCPFLACETSSAPPLRPPLPLHSVGQLMSLVSTTLHRWASWFTFPTADAFTPSRHHFILLGSVLGISRSSPPDHSPQPQPSRDAPRTHRSSASSDFHPPSKPTFTRHLSPHFIAVSLGDAAVDVQFAQFSITMDTSPIDGALFAAMRQTAHRVNYVWSDPRPRPHVWRHEDPGLHKDNVKYLIRRDRAIDLSNQWRSLKHAATRDYDTIVINPSNSSSSRLHRRNSPLPLDSLLSNASLVLSPAHWTLLLDRMIQVSPDGFQVLVFDDDWQSIALPVGNLEVGLRRFSQQQHRLRRGTLANLPQIGMNVLWAYVLSFLSKKQAEQQHKFHLQLHRATSDSSALLSSPPHSGMASLAQNLQFLTLAQDRRRDDENWDADSLIDSHLDQTEAAIRSAAEFAASGSTGHIHPDHLKELPWHDVRETYERERRNGYTPLVESPFHHLTAQSTVSALSHEGNLVGFQQVISAPLVHNDGRMTAYRTIPAPVEVQPGHFIIFAPTQDRVLLVAHRIDARSGHHPWIALSSTQFAQCRRAGNFYSCRDVGVIRPPIPDQRWTHLDADVCAFALHARRPKLAASACERTDIMEDLRCIRIGPYSWSIFSRSEVIPQVSCETDGDFDPTVQTPIIGVGIFRLPPGCKANIAGWSLIADRTNQSAAEPTIFPTEIFNLRQALVDSRQQENLDVHRLVTSLQGPTPVPDSYDTDSATIRREFLIAKETQRSTADDLTNSHWTTPVLVTLLITFLLVVALLAFFWRDYQFKFLGTTRTLSTLFADGPNSPSRMRNIFNVLDERVYYLETQSRYITEALYRANIPYRQAPVPLNSAAPLLPNLPALRHASSSEPEALQEAIPLRSQPTGSVEPAPRRGHVRTVSRTLDHESRGRSTPPNPDPKREAP